MHPANSLLYALWACFWMVWSLHGFVCSSSNDKCCKFQPMSLRGNGPRKKMMCQISNLFLNYHCNSHRKWRVTFALWPFHYETLFTTIVPSWHWINFLDRVPSVNLSAWANSCFSWRNKERKGYPSKLHVILPTYTQQRCCQNEKRFGFLFRMIWRRVPTSGLFVELSFAPSRSQNPLKDQV